MDIVEITLEKLLCNSFINNIEQDGSFYFSKEDLNKIFDNNFKYTPHIIFEIKDDKKGVEFLEFISYREISDQVDHVKNSPSFGENLDKMFGFDINNIPLDQ